MKKLLLLLCIFGLFQTINLTAHSLFCQGLAYTSATTMLLGSASGLIVTIFCWTRRPSIPSDYNAADDNQQLFQQVQQNKRIERAAIGLLSIAGLSTIAFIATIVTC